jgi:hypothetical protein
MWWSRGAVGAMEVELVQPVSCLLAVFIVVHPPRGWSREAAGCDGGGAGLTPEDKADVGCGWCFAHVDKLKGSGGLWAC